MKSYFTLMHKLIDEETKGYKYEEYPFVASIQGSINSSKNNGNTEMHSYTMWVFYKDNSKAIPFEIGDIVYYNKMKLEVKTITINSYGSSAASHIQLGLD